MHRGSRPTVPEAAAAAAETIQKPKLCHGEREKRREIVGKQAARGKQERLADT